MHIPPSRAVINPRTRLLETPATLPTPILNDLATVRAPGNRVPTPRAVVEKRNASIRGNLIPMSATAIPIATCNLWYRYLVLDRPVIAFPVLPALDFLAAVICSSAEAFP